MEIKKAIDELEFILAEKLRLVRTQNYAKAAILRDREKRIIKEFGYDTKTPTKDIIKELRFKKRTEVIDSIIEENEKSPE